jgi:hypothetical protein
MAYFLSGCAKDKPKDSPAPSRFGQVPPASPGSSQPPKLIVTPDDSLVGKVAMVNQSQRFVILNFPLGRLPLKEQHMNLYRRGLKVGEVKVTAMRHDDNVVADLIAGDSAVGDEARNN